MKIINKNVFIILMMALACNYGFSQEKINELLIGKWENVKEELTGLEDESLTIDGEEINTNYLLDFTSKKVDIIENGIETNNLDYVIAKNNGLNYLKFGNRKYVIKKLDEKELILIEDKVILPSTFIFKKK